MNRLLLPAALFCSCLVASPPIRAEPITLTSVKPTGDQILVLWLRIATRTAPLRNRGEFDAYMATTPVSANPVHLLSVDGRRRFIASLDFEEFSQGGIPDSGDIEAELRLSEAWRLLSLFGVQQAVLFMPDIRIETEDDRLIDEWRQVFHRAFDD